MNVDSFDFESELSELWKSFEATVPSLKAQIDDETAQQQREDAIMLDAASASCEKLGQLLARFNAAVDELRGRIEKLEADAYRKAIGQ